MKKMMVIVLGLLSFLALASGDNDIDAAEVERINKEFKAFSESKKATRAKVKVLSDLERSELVQSQVLSKGIINRSSDLGSNSFFYLIVILFGILFLIYLRFRKNRAKSVGVISEGRLERNISTLAGGGEAISSRYVKRPKTRMIYNVPAKLPAEFVIIDFETTGLDANSDEIVQFGGLRIKDGVVVDELEFLVNTFVPISPKAQAVHGISRAMIDRDGVAQEVAFKRIDAFINDSQMMAYHAEFDGAFLDIGAAKHGYSFNRRMICLLRFAREVWPLLRNHKLQTVIDTVGTGSLQKHTALSDCYMALEVYSLGVARVKSFQESSTQ